MSAKIYLNKEDYKKLRTSQCYDTINLKFEKKYVRIEKYMHSIYLLPKVLVSIIMEYMNDLYLVDMCAINSYHACVDCYMINQITNSDGKKLLDADSIIYIKKYFSENEVSITSKLNVYTTFNEKLIDPSHTINDNIIMFNFVNFFNYFMNTYYNKKNYIQKTNYNDYYMLDGCIFVTPYKKNSICISRKIINYKELTNIIVIFKILVRTLLKIYK